VEDRVYPGRKCAGEPRGNGILIEIVENTPHCVVVYKSPVLGTGDVNSRVFLASVHGLRP
jgi:hypothetical protein